MKVYIVDDYPNNEIAGCYSTLEKAQEKIIELMKEEIALEPDDEDTVTFYTNKIKEIKTLKTVEETNNLIEDYYMITEREFDK